MKNLRINQDNVNLLKRQVETNQARLERGQITISDLAQSEVFTCRCTSTIFTSKNETITAKLTYEKIIGPIVNTNTLSKNSD